MRVLITCLLLNSLNCLGQSNSVQSIRNHYNSIGEKISHCKNGQECELYLNELTVNKLDGEWRGVGNYKKTVQFWYNDDPQHCDECGEDGIHVLQKIEIEEISSVYRTRYEFLFNQGELIFYFLKNERIGKELRYYLEKNTLIRYMKNQTVKPIEDVDFNRIIKNSKELQSLFIHSFR